MNRQWRGIGTYLMVLALVCMLLAFFDEQRQNSVSYSYPQFTKAVEEDQIQSASIQPNQETPTGTVTYQLKDGTQKVTQILDTEKTSELLDDAGVAYDIAEVKQPGFFETYGTTLDVYKRQVHTQETRMPSPQRLLSARQRLTTRLKI